MTGRRWVVQRVVVDDRVIDAGVPHDVIDPVWWKGNIYGTVAEYEASLAAFSRRQRLLFAALWYFAEVNNGGHDQFFANSTGIVWPDALEALRELGLAEFAAIVEESGRRLGGMPDRDRDVRLSQLESTAAEFDDLDERLYDLEGKIDVDASMARYIRAHREDFYFDGSISKPSA